MTKGSYEIGGKTQKDASFKSCLCSLLIFIAICAIILLVGIIRWTHNGDSKDPQKDKEYLEYLAQKSATPKENQKITDSVPTTTSTTTTTTTDNPILSIPNSTLSTTTTTVQPVYLITEPKEYTTTTSPPVKTTTSATTITTTVTNKPLQENNITTDAPNVTYSTTTPSGLEDFSSSMLIDVRFEPNQTDITTTEALERTTDKTTTTTQQFQDLMEVVEATGFDSTDPPYTTTDTTTDKKQLNETTTTTKPANVTETIQQLRQMPTTTKKPEEPVCYTAACKSVASRMLSLMNHSIDPCEDFYEFACGGMQVDNDNSGPFRRILEQIYLINDTSPKYLQTFKTFYDSCVSHEYVFNYDKRTANVRSLVKEVGNILDEDPGPNVLDMTEIFAKLLLRRSLLIMDVNLDIDKKTSKFILKLTVLKFKSVFSGKMSHSVSLTDHQRRCLDQEREKLIQPKVELNAIHDRFIECQKDYSVFLSAIETAVAALGFFSHWNNTFNRTQAMQELRTTIEWDLLEHLNVLPHPNEYRETILLKVFTIKKVSDLQKEYGYLDWKRFFNILTNRDLDDDTLVQVYFPEYFEALFGGLNALPKWKVNNAVIAMYAYSLYENLVIPKAKGIREYYCVHLGTTFFRDVSSNLYMKTWTKTDLEEIDQFMTGIFNTIKKKVVYHLKGSEWLDEQSKSSMLIKAQKMTLTFNRMNDSYNDDKLMQQKYEGVALNGQNFIYNVVEMMDFDRKAFYNLTGEVFNVDYLWSYFVSVFDTSPTSFYTERLIMAPVGMVKQPVKGYPSYITMSRIGLSLAREMGHHFDQVGIQNDMTLSPASKSIYDEMVTVIKSDYLLNAKNKQVKQQQLSFTVNPNLSANERIADNAGLYFITTHFNYLKAADTLPWISKTFTKQKIFFISVAQEYCQVTNMIDYMLALFESEVLPPSIRVENVITNSEVFEKTFECPVGSFMNNNPMKVQFPNLLKDANISEEDSEYT